MERVRKVMTLVLVHEHPKILLGLKKRGFGAGRWNGFGGKVKEGETIEQAAFRELKEEAGIDVGRLEKRGQMIFQFTTMPDEPEVHLFAASEIEGEPAESEEMKPQWFFVDEIPFKNMWPDDIYWMPLFLKGRKFQGRFLFGPGDAIIEKELDLVSSFDSYERSRTKGQ